MGRGYRYDFGCGQPGYGSYASPTPRRRPDSPFRRAPTRSDPLPGWRATELVAAVRVASLATASYRKSGLSKVIPRSVSPSKGAANFNGRDASIESDDRSVFCSHRQWGLVRRLTPCRTPQARLGVGGTYDVVESDAARPLDCDKHLIQSGLDGNSNEEQPAVRHGDSAGYRSSSRALTVLVSASESCDGQGTACATAVDRIEADMPSSSQVIGPVAARQQAGLIPHE